MTDARPIVAVTMGDPAGIGPEIAVRALLDRAVREVCRPFVIGDLRVLEQAATFCGLSARFHATPDAASLADAAGTIDVMDLHVVDPAGLRIGQIQPLGGEAAFAYVRRSAELAMRREVAAVVTAPINKESLKVAGVPFIGHTEMYAHLTGAHEEMTMFSILDLRIFFLTRHVSLAEACRLITKDRVLAGIEKSLRALHQLGHVNPHLAVAGLNPHAGDGGLFGREDIDEIAPAVAEAQARGLRVSGPLPADSVFHLARLGRFDAVLSLYHDQGHIAAKMMDFERTVSVTLGLPILRTSVDHGTAFDIAGTGKASAVSLIEAIRVAARYAVQGVRLAA
jgi:4-hydroxythreonine-4-phosphate dehydrogenase